ncbi:chorismate lyase [Gallaecimonas sp. GXIMD4217]|uniref:chorismate--pyruvate lyase family protein n=1 Tax=Gallaecimonas sp. GXIMD4217 TaxID=3131927 RepID=UPI00311AFC45
MIEACWPLSATALAPEQVPKAAGNWLLDRGSLTARIKASCDQFELTLLEQGRGELAPAVRLCLGLPQQFYQRQVCLKADGRPWVYGLSFWSGEDPRLAGLGDNALGELLFSEPHWQRGDIVPLQLDASALPAALGCRACGPLWGRASRFSQGRRQLWVLEVFLPQSPVYLDSQ